MQSLWFAMLHCGRNTQTLKWLITLIDSFNLFASEVFFVGKVKLASNRYSKHLLKARNKRNVTRRSVGPHLTVREQHTISRYTLLVYIRRLATPPPPNAHTPYFITGLILFRVVNSLSGEYMMYIYYVLLQKNTGKNMPYPRHGFMSLFTL